MNLVILLTTHLITAKVCDDVLLLRMQYMVSWRSVVVREQLPSPSLLREKESDRNIDNPLIFRK